jgi:hypothetical protein
MKKLFPTGIAALLLATGAAPAAENKWEADCRRGYITKLSTRMTFTIERQSMER